MGQWFHVVEHCVVNRIFPTVLFFERLDPEEQVKRSNKFLFTKAEQNRILQKTKKADRDPKDDVCEFEGVSIEEIKMQE